MYFGIDFDGTCVKHRYPAVGEDVPGAVSVLKKLVASGHQLILFTMRSDMKRGKFGGDAGLTAAIKWFNDRDIPLYGIQANPTQKAWTTSPKAYAHVYIDDAALGAPLVYPEGERPYINWIKVEEWLIQQELV